MSHGQRLLRYLDQQREVERLLELGATRADVGQGDESWVVLADPEGNEFCVLTDRRGRAGSMMCLRGRLVQPARDR
jgi:hypothetical protein